MRKILAALLMILALFACQSEIKHKERKDEKNVIVFQVTREDDKAVKLHIKERRSLSAFYDKFGKHGERLELAEKVEYDEVGNKLVQIKYFSGEKVHTAFGFDYDSEGNNIAMLTKDGEGIDLYTRTSDFDGQGNEITRIESQVKSEEKLITEFEYDNKNRLSKRIIETESGVRRGTEEFSYDGEFPAKAKYYDEKEVLYKEIIYNFDDAGKMIHSIKTDGRLRKDTTFYRYNDAGNCIEIDQGYFKQRFKYNKAGNVVEESTHDKDGYTQQKFKYFYDYMGLWDYRIKYDGEDNPILYTKFEYDFYKK